MQKRRYQLLSKPSRKCTQDIGILAIVCLLLVITNGAAEKEGKQQVPSAEVLAEYNSIIAEMTPVIVEKLTIEVLPMPFDYKARADVLVESLGLAGDPLGLAGLSRTSDEGILRLAAYATIVMQKLFDTNVRRSKSVSDTDVAIAACLVEKLFFPRVSALSGPKWTNLHDHALSALDSLDEKYGYRKACSDFVLKGAAELPVTGNTFEERLASWAKLCDEATPDALRDSFYIQWLFDNVKPESVLNPNCPAEVDISKGVMSLISEHIQPGFVKSSDAKWAPHGRKIDSAPPSVHARVRYAVLHLVLRAADGEYNWARNYVVQHTMQHFGIKRIPLIESLRVHDVCAAFRKATSDFGVAYQIRTMSPKFRLKVVHEGTGGPAWFMAAKVPEQQAGKKHIESDVVLPLLYYESAADTGFTSLVSLYKDKEFFPWSLSQTGFYDWAPSLNSSEVAEPKPKLSAKVNADIEWDFSLSGINAMIASHGKLFIQGSAKTSTSQISEAMKDTYRTGVFYHYPSTKWKMYSYWVYDADSDYAYYERPIYLVAVEPGDAPCDAAMPGLYSSEFDVYWVQCGIRRWGNVIWNAWAYRCDEANKATFEIAEKETKALDDTDGKRWKVAAEELERRRRQAFGVE